MTRSDFLAKKMRFESCKSDISIGKVVTVDDKGYARMHATITEVTEQEILGYTVIMGNLIDFSVPLSELELCSSAIDFLTNGRSE